MKRQILVSLLVLLAITGLAAAKNSRYKEGELIVRFADTDVQLPTLAIPLDPLSGYGIPTGLTLKPKVQAGPLSTRARRNAVSNSIMPGATVLQEYDRIVPGLALVKLPKGRTVADAVFQFNRSPNVLYAEPNYKRRLSLTPNDPFFTWQWNMNNTGQTGGTVDADIDAPEAWEIRTGTGVVVAVTDTGIDYEHVDVNENMWINPGEDMPVIGIPDDNDFNGVDDDGNGKIDDIYGWDFAGDSWEDPFDDDDDPMDPLGHGTHVAGIIGAEGNNGIGVTGVCWDAKLMALKIFADDYDPEDPTAGALVSDITQAIDYAISKNARIINASWGGGDYSVAEYQALERARDDGILFIAAAGNYGMNNDSQPFYPASYNLNNIISVMATNHYDNRAYYSNYGPSTVDLGAPGGEIFLNDATGGILSLIPDDTYDYMQGTSMAAPHVSGAAALMWAVNPSLTYSRVKTLLLYSVDRTLPGQCISGGRLNLERALKVARPTTNKILNVNTAEKFSSIQAAINDSDTLDGHEIIAQKDYYYFENIDFNGKNVTIRSGNISSPGDTTVSPTNTFISGFFGSDYIVRIDSGEDASAVLKGFTISDGDAGSIHIGGSSPTITDCIITNNNGGIYCWDAPAPSITDCTITDNTDSSGGIFCHKSSPIITNCHITDNRTTMSGGGIYCESNSDPDITNCTISDNTTAEQGGGVYCEDNSNPDITNCTITDNTAEWEGGGIYCDNSSPTINDNTISDNRSDYAGGGIYTDSGSNAVITNNIIRNNSALYWGGGIYCYDSSAVINNCLVVDNSVDSWDGGGIYCENASPSITNCTIVNNSASESGGIGGGLCSYDLSEPNVTDCIFSGNGDYAIALYEDGYGGESDPNVTFCLFYDNAAGDYVIYDDSAGTVTKTVYTGAD